MYVEQDCTIEHEGQTFEAGGAVVTPEYAIGYCDGLETHYRGTFSTDGVIMSWHGAVLGEVYTCRRFSNWQPHLGLWCTMFQVTAIIDGVKYTGRTQGNGMIWKGKRVAKQ